MSKKNKQNLIVWSLLLIVGITFLATDSFFIGLLVFALAVFVSWLIDTYNHEEL